MLSTGFNELRQCQQWGLPFDENCSVSQQFWAMADNFDKTLTCLETYKAIASTPTIPFFTSHEALHLHYEAALTQFNEASQRWYNLSTHFPWLGMRTAFPDSAHVEYLRGIANPICLLYTSDAADE